MNIKWVARDEDGGLWLYPNKPEKTAHQWVGVNNNDGVEPINDTFFSKVKWEDDEPMMVGADDDNIYLVKDVSESNNQPYFSEPHLTMPIPRDENTIYHFKPYGKGGGE